MNDGIKGLPALQLSPTNSAYISPLMNPPYKGISVSYCYHLLTEWIGSMNDMISIADDSQ